jgi:hydrogenase maturation protein HypF
MEVRRLIDVSGIVQGVGFRPYVYRLATERRLTGTVSNTASGVTIEVEGPRETVEDFVACLPEEAPPLARITDLSVRNLLCNGDCDFRILPSHKEEGVRTLISPDVAICDDCLRELFDPQDRRYRYPFINCTNCGPRFTIASDIPYDRRNTSMAVFSMCPDCLKEYDNPLDRRFHAQPNACWQCGPRLEFWDKEGRPLGETDPVVASAAALRAGMILAVKGLGGFHLAADATNPDAVCALRERKRRVEKPFAIMVADVAIAERLCLVSGAARRALQSSQRPIVLLPRKHHSPVVDQVAPFNRQLGAFLPYTPLHYLLLAECGLIALVMTSGNLSEEPIAIDNREALMRLNGLADCFLVHNRDILRRSDDSVARVVSGKLRHVRRSRGYVPVPVFLREDLPPILAVGGELKNTICLTKGKHAFLSQHVGDLENLEGYRFFGEAIAHLETILEIRPEIVAYDLHPDYFSTRWALQQKGVRLVGTQHHHAHIASCMAENHLDGSVIGFALDGTGYGTDGNIWGGEILIAGYNNFERAAHFEYVPMPGGVAAIREPWRMAISYLAHYFGRDFLKLRIPFLDKLDHRKTELILNMIECRLNSPLTSSCGRLFDAVAALAGIRQQVNYEAQAAIELEMALDSSEPGAAYRFDLLPNGDGWIISSRSMFEAIIEDLHGRRPISAISQRFHDGLVDVFLRVADLVHHSRSLDRVCLSGGAFHNAYLLENLSTRLTSAGFEVFTHGEVPAGDGGLSLGQALIAANRCNNTRPEEGFDSL